MIHYDPRWSGPHGIGRFSDEVISRLGPVRPLRIGVRKLSPLDPIATALAVARLRSGAYFSPSFNGPVRCPVPFAFCIFDLIHLRFEQESSVARRAYYSLVVKPASRRAARVFTISAHSRQSILEWSGLPEDRVRSVSCGVGRHFVPEGRRHAPGYPYFLFVGRREPHKNVPRLLQAFAAARCRSDLRLVFTGAPDAVTEAEVRRLNMSGAVIFSPGIGDEELAAYYRGAAALAFPSLYEGFGLPIAEAMACGTPVITSNVTAMPETAGDGNALMVDPLSVDAIRDAMERIAADDGLRASLRERGLAQARKFSWDEVARLIRTDLERA
jgi:glycosyltransferase involved in cell wall biosynthesis